MKIILKKYSIHNLPWTTINKILINLSKLSRIERYVPTINKIEKISLAYDWNNIIWIGCIKIPRKSYVKKLLEKTNIDSLPKREIWYFYVNKKYRWMGIADKLLKELNKTNLFATTSDDNIAMQKILKNNNFQKIWNWFKSDKWNYNIYLFINTTQNS